MHSEDQKYVQYISRMTWKFRRSIMWGGFLCPSIGSSGRLLRMRQWNSVFHIRLTSMATICSSLALLTSFIMTLSYILVTLNAIIVNKYPLLKRLLFSNFIQNIANVRSAMYLHENEMRYNITCQHFETCTIISAAELESDMIRWPWLLDLTSINVKENEKGRKQRSCSPTIICPV
jgi:hypothetical protein